MASLRASLRAAILANRFLGYILTLLLTGYSKAYLVKKLEKAMKEQKTLVDLWI